MNIKDGIELKGHLKIESKENNEDWKTVVDKQNLIVNVGKEFIMDRIFTNATGYIAYFGVGSSLTTANATDTNILEKTDITSSAAPHKTYTAFYDSGTHITMKFDLITTEPTVQPCSISEFGTFTLVSGGSLFSRVVHTPIVKNNSTELRYYYDVVVNS